MHFKYLNLKKARIQVVKSDLKKSKATGRRKFIKAMGLGTIAWNPVVESISSFSVEPFTVKRGQNYFGISRNNELVWEISEKVFKPGFNLQTTLNSEFIKIEAKRLSFKFADFTFSLDARIIRKNSNWIFVFQIPEFNFKMSCDFVNWLDGVEDLYTDANPSVTLINLNNYDRLEIDGHCKLRVNRDWQIHLKSKKSVFCYLNSNLFKTGELILIPNYKISEEFLFQSVRYGSLIILPEFKSWEKFFSEFRFEGTEISVNGGSLPDLNFLSSKTTKLLWINHENGFSLFNDKVSDSAICFKKTFYYAEYLNETSPKTYISSVLPDEGTWLTNKLGSFKIEKDTGLPDFEAFGTGNAFDNLFFEPRLRAFNPNVPGAVTLKTTYQDPQRIRITNTQKNVTVSPQKSTTITNDRDQRQQERKTQETPQNPLRNITIQRQENQRETNQREQPQQRQTIEIPKIQIQRTPQRPGRNVRTTQPEIEVQFDQLKFRPKQAIKIRVLRPEDMILLEFEFHNFNFTNRGQAPYLELDKPKEQGIVVIYFQSQHTLEEAYFESTPIPDPDGGSSENVRLPAKHIRARKTRLVYELPAGHVGFPLIMDELLDWTKFKLRVHPRAWIKLPSLGKVKIPARVLQDKKTTIPLNKNTRYLSGESKEYGLKLAQNTKTKTSNLAVYEENEISKVLMPQSSMSVKSSFNVSSLRRIDLSVGPIPDLSTSIEAPALMYISPNQANDFHHKIDITFRDVNDTRLNLENEILNLDLRVLDPLKASSGEVTELWHTRLGVKLSNGKTSITALPGLKTIRALWADDAQKTYDSDVPRNQPFMASLDANNRHKLVHTTSNYGAGFTPIPVPVNDIMLTTLGAYLDWHAFFDVPTPQDNYLNIIEWEHIATLGRDHYVKVVEEGYLFPFGHRAAVVKITERKFHNQTKSAVNRQRMFVVVLEKEVLYSRNDPDGKFIEFPFQAVHIKTNATPNIDNPEVEGTRLIIVPPSSGGNLRRMTLRRTTSNTNTAYNFYINVGGKGFPFDIIATDKEGLEHPFRMPLVFLENRVARDKELVEEIIEVYQGDTGNDFNKVYNEAGLNGQEVAYAEYLVDGDTAFETETVKFDAQIYPVDGEGDLKFHPKMKEARIYVKQIDEMTGSKQPTTIGLEDDNNAGDVFARVISDAVVDFSGGSDKSGGFLLPNMAVSGLSKLQGPVSGSLDNLKDLLFIPEEFFSAFEDLPVAKIFGVIEIFSLLFGDSGSPFDLGGVFDDMKNTVKSIRDEIEDIKNDILYLENLAEETQQMVEDQINDLKQQIKNKVNELLSALNDSIPRIPNLKAFVTEEAFYAEYKWQPQLGGKTIEVFPGLLNVKVDDPNTALSITTKFEKPFDSDKQASLNGLARFEKFGVDIVPLLGVNFNYLEFKTGSSEKTDVKVDIDKNNPIEFKGVLNFVNNLQSIIPSTGFSDDGPYIDIKPTGVTAGFDISIPNVEVGICMISNISLGANITLPFTGAPLTMGFNFCKRENPFLLTISCFGGGGYFMMVTTLKGMQSIEAAFEFGAAISLNVGVASGGVSAMGGFYFKMELVGGEEQCTLTGYLRLNGHLSILGLISLSLEFYLALTAVIYDGKVQKMEGVATLKVKVEVLFFSKTVSVSVRRELKGADADPKFVEMIDQDDWQEYCMAFAS